MASVVQAWGDVFAYDTSLCHAVSQEFHMKAGIARDFRAFFGRVEELRNQGKRVGEVAFLVHNGHHIFYLITKEHYWDKGSGVTVNIVTPLPQVHGMAVAGDSQALRYLISRSKLPSGFNKFSREVGLCGSGWTLSRLLEALEPIPDNALDNVLVLIGSNDVLAMSKSENPRQLRKATRNRCSALRAVLADKCKAYCRAVVATVPPLPQVLSPWHADEKWINKARHSWEAFNQGMLRLSCNRFYVINLAEHFMQNSVVQEDLFERFMGVNKRMDRIHINRKGMAVLDDIIKSIPPVSL